jgi:hypothetical protein
MSFARRVSRRNRPISPEVEDASDVDESIPTNHLKLPVGTVLSDPIKGEFLAIPIFGYVCRRIKANTPLIMLTLILMTSEGVPQGTIQVELPIFPDTELAVLGALEGLGWDGRVWPEDPGWPTGDKESEENLLGLMAQARLGSTLTFPPNDKGAAAMTIDIQRAQGPFLMPPLADYVGEPDPELLAKFRAVYSGATRFIRSPVTH